jgi:hypothetical protein
MVKYPLLCLAATALLAGACDRSPSGSSGGVPTDELVFLRAQSAAPPPETAHGEVWAVQGDNAEIRLRRQPLPGQSSGEDLLRFRVSGNTQIRRPDGTALARGDSIRITVDVVDPSRFQYQFAPSGIRFEREPAELRVSYAFANPDFNNDGRVDSRDDDFDFGFWKQEQPGDDWTRIGDLRLHDLKEVRGVIDGFTGYALAGGTRQAN